MAAAETAERRRMAASYSDSRPAYGDETKNALKTTEFFAMVGVNAAILIAAWVSDSLDDVRAWTLVAASLDRLHHQPRAGQVGQQVLRV
jgi:hypothetical protein